MQAKLSPSEKNAIEQSPTSDITAFDLYAQAKNVLAIRNARANLLQAADLLNQAVARDPSFFQAYCQLAHTHDRLYFLGYDHTPARLALAEAAVQAAFRLRPDAGEAHLARAQNLYRGYLDYDGALAELEVARQTLPNDAGVLELKGYIQRRQGKQEEAVRSLERAIDLDPRNISRCSRSRSVTIISGVLPKKNRYWTALWLSSRMMLIQEWRGRSWNSIGKPIPGLCINLSIQSGPRIPLPRKVSPMVGFFVRWRNATGRPPKCLDASGEKPFTDEAVLFIVHSSKASSLA